MAVSLRKLLSPVFRWFRPDGTPTRELYQYMQEVDARLRDHEDRLDAGGL